MKAQKNAKSSPKNISVFLRIRPPVAREKEHSFKSITYDKDNKQVVTISRDSASKNIIKNFVFNRVFSPSDTQEEVYNCFAKNAVDAAFDGQHGVLFVYGQTGSGKTFTVSNDDGNPENLGVLQRATRDIWNRINSDKKNEYTCSVSYVQLYNEILTDLLDEARGRVRIQMDPQGCGDVVLVSETTGLPIVKDITNFESTMKWFNLGSSRKEMQSTSMNQTSSRSHTIFTINIKKSTKTNVVKVNNEDSAEDMEDGNTISLEGRLVLCDLAGSERVSKTHAEGKVLNEATHINGSLLVLGKVVHALTEKNCQHAPFRESKLTRILQYSLLGNGNTSLVVNISPSDDNIEESMSSIGFGQRAIQIKQDAIRHEVLDYKALYLQLMAELDAKNDTILEDALADERAVYEMRISEFEDQIAILTEENDALRVENEALRKDMPPEKVASILAAAGGSWKGVHAAENMEREKHHELLRTLGNERLKLAVLLSEEKLKCLRLAKKMQCIIRDYKLESKVLNKRNDELCAELAAAKGTDYLNAIGAMGFSPATAKSMNFEASSEAGEDSAKTNALIRAYRNERMELIVYQFKAQKAIRMLVMEKEALRRKLEGK